MAHRRLVRTAPHGLHELLHLLSLVQCVPQCVLRAHQLVLQSQELRRGGWVNEGVAPLIRQGLLSVLEAAKGRKSVGVGVCLCVCARACVCQGTVASLLGRKLSGSTSSLGGS